MNPAAKAYIEAQVKARLAKERIASKLESRVEFRLVDDVLKHR